VHTSRGYGIRALTLLLQPVPFAGNQVRPVISSEGISSAARGATSEWLARKRNCPHELLAGLRFLASHSLVAPLAALEIPSDEITGYNGWYAFQIAMRGLTL
jgi:hypothetical protein